MLQFDVQTQPVSTVAGGVVSGSFTSSIPGGQSNTTIITKSDTTAGITVNSGTLLGITGAANAADNYRGYTIAITNANGTAYSIIGSSFLTYSAPNYFYRFDLLAPLPSAITNGDKITLIPPVQLQRGGAQNFIKRLRVLYGSLVLEDILEYKTLVRIFYESGVDPGLAAGSNNVLEGSYSSRNIDASPNSGGAEANNNVVFGSNDLYAAALCGMIQSCGPFPAGLLSQLQLAPAINSGNGQVQPLGTAASFGNTGRYTFCINLLSGLFTQKKVSILFLFFHNYYS